MTTSATPNTPAHEHGGDHDVHRPRHRGADPRRGRGRVPRGRPARDPGRRDRRRHQAVRRRVRRRRDEPSVASGAFYSFLGPSGCGKTTTLRMIAGFEQPTAGEIYLAGEPVAGVPPYRRNVNTVFQHYALFPHMNVTQNVGYGLRQKKVTKADEAPARRRGARARPPVGLRAAPDLGAVRRPAAARRARAGARQPPHGAAPGRAARRPRPASCATRCRSSSSSSSARSGSRSST